jgi:hypothetical protein
MAWRAVVLGVVAVGVVACGADVDGADSQGAAVDPESTDPADAPAEQDDVAPTETDEAADDDGAADGDGAAESDGAADGDADEGVQDLLADLDFGDGGARVVLGDRTFEFTLGGNSPEVDGKTYLGVCQTLFGAIAGAGYQIQDDRVATIEFELPPADWESYEDGRFDTSPPRMKIEDVATEEAWMADLTLADSYPDIAGSSQIDAWVTDGTRASGTATFTAITPWSAPVDGAEPLQGSFELGCADD